MAAGQLGVYGVPINWHFTRRAGYILADSGAKVLVAHSDLLAQIAGGVPGNVKVLVVPTPEEIAAAYNVPPREAAGPGGRRDLGRCSSRATRRTRTPPKAARGSMIYTSGTTGRPKGVRRRRPRPSCRRWPPARPPSTGASGQIPRSWSTDERPDVPLRARRLRHGQRARLGLNMVLQPRFEAEDMLRLIDRQKVSHMHIVPTHVRAPAAPAR